MADAQTGRNKRPASGDSAGGKKAAKVVAAATAAPDTPKAAKAEKPIRAKAKAGAATQTAAEPKKVRHPKRAKKRGATDAGGGKVPSRSYEFGPKKIFVLDTNVFMHDPSSIFRFEEHDIFVPMTTLEELDNNKKGMSDASRNARQISRTFDEILQSHDNGIDSGIDLTLPSGGIANGRLFFQSEATTVSLPEALPSGKGDNQILAVVLSLQQKHHRQQVVLVSKDINIRIKARALGLDAEDYLNDQVVDDSSLLPAGLHELDRSFWNKQGSRLRSRHEEGGAVYDIQGEFCRELALNTFVHVKGDDFTARVIRCTDRQATIKVTQDYTSEKHAVAGIMARNMEQNLAFNLLMDDEIDFVTLLGQAGTGKTLVTLAAAVELVHKKNKFAEILITRATVSMGEDIGFLPGSEEEKMSPWMGAIDDNLEVLTKAFPSLDKPNAMGQLKAKMKIKSMNFMRGRTFQRKFVIIDEAQNLTPKQMKALVTRAGPGTKMVCLGNLAQIDTPYLTEGSSGLTYVVDRFRNWQHAGHLTLSVCERSRLAEHAVEVL